MQKSLFLKYFSMFLSILLICILVLAMILSVFAGEYFKKDKYSLLAKNVNNAIDITLRNYRKNQYVGISEKDVMLNYSLISQTTHSTLFLVDLDGKTEICTDEEVCNHRTYLVPENIMTKIIQDGYYQEVGVLGGIYSEPTYIVAAPVIVNDQVIAVIFNTTSAQSLSDFIRDLLNMFMVSALVVILISFVIIYFVTLSMVKPLQNMASIVKEFSRGDFSKRIKVDTQEVDEVGALALAFNNMADNLSNTENVRKSFIANVSHELKTPMTTIAGFVDGILDGTIPEEKEKHYLSIISLEVKRLSRLVRSMLNIARIEAGELHISPANIDINELVCQTIFTFEQKIESKNIDIRGLDVGRVMVNADKDLIHQVIYNLLENAVKFTPQDGYIEINYTDDPQYKYISFKNSGKGIPKDEISKIFDRFYKSDTSRSNDTTGVGLGLHIVRSIINLHRGKIMVKSLENEYCEFAFSLPNDKGSLLKRTRNNQ